MPSDDPLNQGTARPVNRLGPVPSGIDAIPYKRRRSPCEEIEAEFRQRECYRQGYLNAMLELVMGLAHGEIRRRYLTAAEIFWRGQPRCIEATREGIEDALAGRPMKSD
jgi:hypothetical protein